MSSQLWPVHLEYLVYRIVATADTADTAGKPDRSMGMPFSPIFSVALWLCGSVAKPLSQRWAFTVQGRAYSTAKEEEFLEMNFILRRGVVVAGPDCLS